VSYAQRGLNAEGFGDGDDIAAEITPGIWGIGFRATAVTTDLDGDAPAFRESACDLIPRAPVESGGVREQNRRVGSWPLPGRNLRSV
jgi:hypothetical protein